MDDLVCYCYEHSKEDIRQDYKNNGRSLIIEKIMEKKMLGRCQCATKNPKGK
jgi:hypothetical protein